MADAYQQSFDELTDLRLSPEAPSAPTLESLRRYAERRLDASRALVDGLRAHDIERVREALEQASQPPPRVKPQSSKPN